MALVVDRPRMSAPMIVRIIGGWIIPVAVVATIALRLPFLLRSPSPDEAGFLMVGAGWHAGGTSLYGNYWVDRPPLLIGLFHLSSALGGLTALRLLGCVAAGLIVLGSSFTAGMIAGRRAARWSAIVAAALCTTPLLGTGAVNGELLAAPFVVGSIAAAVGALRAAGDRRAAQLAVTAGAAAMCALLVKQNFADAFVFGLVATTVAWRRGDISGRRASRVLVSAGGGAALATFAIALVTSLLGTSLSGVFDAMYPFRFAASRVLAEGGRQYAAGRLDGLINASVTSGLTLLVVMVIWGAVSRRLGGATVVGLCATLGFAAISIAVGGNYWAHYLVEPIVPLTILTGVLIVRGQPFLKPLAVVTVAASAVAWSVGLVNSHPSTGSTVGHSIAASAKTGDTIFTAYGHADVDQTSGLSSPYRYLWSLPIKTLDPQLSELNLVLSGPRAPTWFVAWNKIRSWGLQSGTVESTVQREYRPVARICGRTIYLRNGINRPTPQTQANCANTSALGTASKGKLP